MFASLFTQVAMMVFPDFLYQLYNVTLQVLKYVYVNWSCVVVLGNVFKGKPCFISLFQFLT